MKIYVPALDLILATQCKTTADLRPGASSQTLAKIRRGEDVRPDVVGRIARALNVAPADILKEAD